MGAWGFAQIIGVHGPLSPIMPQRNADDRKKRFYKRFWLRDQWNARHES